MLKLKNITKTYQTAGESVHALKGIDIEFRKSEFVSILGQSGCGKTTLLNIIGGLDRYTEGDLIIKGKSTKDYKDRDWDFYRNYSVGFVFQSYNLIPHQSVLSNVELALTISGYSKVQKKQMAIDALKSVGLGNQIHKNPNQLSGGQMQRVAIARAIVNNPDIILADEPTGALDTKTSLQIMELLKEISKDKLIVMVTHNPELAQKYSSRTVKLVDGKIIHDSNPFDSIKEKKEFNTANTKREYKNNLSKKTKMTFTTAFGLSLNNLMTKKGRTILTAFAGSIGIIGIALILSLSSGINNYIDDIQKSTMVSYPISIESETMDLSSILNFRTSREGMIGNEDADKHDNDAVYSNGSSIEKASKTTISLAKNNLTEFKKYLESENCEITKYLSENGIICAYDTNFRLYAYDKDEQLINTDGSTFEEDKDDGSSSNTMNMSSSPMSQISETRGMPIMGSENSELSQELMPGIDGDLVSNTIKYEYSTVYGNWPTNYNEVVLLLDENNEISSTKLYKLGMLPSSEYKDYLKKIDNGEEIKVDTKKLSYEEICNQEFYLIPSCDFYKKQDNGLYKYLGDDTTEVDNLVKNNAIKLKISGIIKQNEDSENSIITSIVGYTKALTDYIIDYTNKSDVVIAQEADKTKSVINGLRFEVTTDEEKAEDAKEYISTLGVSDKATLYKSLLTTIYADNQAMMARTARLNEEQLASAMDTYLENPDNDTLVSIYDSYIKTKDYNDNMKLFGKISLDAPSTIDIYTDSFEGKEAITDAIDKYNKTASEDNQITYTDYIGILMSSITTIINVISYVLIAFVSISLVVSSIMIAIITYISVLERTKEIGILRAMGTSKKDVSKIFNAETFIEGLCAGLIGIGITSLLNIPINMIIEKIVGISGIASLPLSGGIALIIISILLTVLAGLVPSKLAAKKDPAEVLRSE